MIKILLVFWDGPAGGVDAIHHSNMVEARGDHRVVVGERGDLFVGVVANMACFGFGWRRSVVSVLNLPLALATVSLPRNAMKPRRSLENGGQRLAIRVDIVELIPQVVALDVGVVREGGLLLVVVPADLNALSQGRAKCDYVKTCCHGLRARCRREIWPVV